MQASLVELLIAVPCIGVLLMAQQPMVRQRPTEHTLAQHAVITHILLATDVRDGGYR